MPVFRLGGEHVFPPVELAENGLLALGGDLVPERLLLAYRRGIFPWYSEGEPILWHSPDPRFVLHLSDFRCPRSARRAMRDHPFRLTCDTAFREVIEYCASVPRAHEEGTWITEEMQDAYCALHRLGYAHSIEARVGDDLAGGLYGVSLGGAFFGESMFTLADDASKVALVTLIEQLGRWGFSFLDCQIESPHMRSYGAVHVSRAIYLERLAAALEQPTRRGPWSLDRS